MRHIEKSEIEDYRNVIPTLMNLMDYPRFQDKSSDSLMRCSECGIKHDLHDLSRVGVGKFICRFCNNGVA